MFRCSAIAIVLLAVAPTLARAQGAAGAMVRLLESGRVPPERQGTIIEMIVARGEADDLAAIFKRLLQPDGMPPATRRRVVELLTDAAITRQVRPAGDLSPLTRFIDGEAAAKDRRLQVAAIRLAAAWKLNEAEAALQHLATAENADESLQIAAIDALVAVSGARSRPSIEKLAAVARSTRLRIAAAAALARLDSGAAAKAAAEVLAKIGPQDDVGPLLGALLGRKDGAEKLAEALAARPLPADAAKIALRYMYSVGRSDQALSDVLSKAAGIAQDAPPPTAERTVKIAAEVAVKGDAARGERVFRRADLSCLKCHAVAQAGGSVGPDLSALGSISPVDYIVNSILNPTLAVKEQFVTRRVLTLDGEVITGIQVDRDEQRLRLRDAAGKIVTIPVANIDQEGEGQSLMPQGLTRFLTEQELLDLTRFVSELGKPGPYAIRKTPSIQRWRVLKTPGPELTAEVPNVEVFREQVLDTSEEAWTTAYGMVGGELPLAELTPSRPAVLYLQGEIDVTAAGAIAVQVSCSEPVQVWIDAEPFQSAANIARDLSAGKHTLTFRVSVGTEADPRLKVELTRPAGSGAQFVVLNGM
jgi:putative heme-binding domain-containing protein